MVRPCVRNDLTSVAAAVPTIRGTVAVDWSRPAPGQFILKVTVPVNSKATVYVPAWAAQLTPSSSRKAAP